MGGLGVLDVIVDGRVVFSRQSEGALPATSEIVARVRRG
jgi:predicted Rdx family selenoprotein